MTARLRVIVLTCGTLGIETADALAALPGFDTVGVIVAPHRRPSFRKRLRRIHRGRGTWGTIRFLAARLLRSAAPADGEPVNETPGHRVPVLHVSDFHAADGLAAMRRLEPDLAIVDGTGILRETVFALPSGGSINLHCGKVPAFRGSPPAFWELHHGVPEVGVTIHRVAAQLDAGPILAEEVFPFDIAPRADPMQHIDQYWRTVLRPNGIRMLGEVASAIAAGTATEKVQPPHDAPPNRTPTHDEISEVRRRVRQRRRG